MPKRSTVKSLPKAVKEWLDAALVESNFSGYRELEAELKARGYDISKSAVHRYGQALERRLAAIKASTEAAKVITQNISDDNASQSTALLEMIQSEILSILVQLEEAEGEENQMARLKAMSFLGKNISPLISAGVSLKKYQTEIKARAETAAKEVEKIVKKNGLTEEAADTVRKHILGIA
ncbi:DUF3486 family protein [Pasteurella multocida]|uniref:DUF3486 family protein n=1 Tax=Pasteurella multocida TaxID=747 RepID=UPI002B6439AB|nr:DUF3486 family protein [Pasteurella multocida]MEB3496511.1 DUF3486 family protein [Pasteurella multocida]